MTTLVAWISYPENATPLLPGAMYVASDSRITWGSDASRWDAGRKIFCPVEQPHIFGYCGDVVFPSLVLGQITSAIDLQLLFAGGATADEKNGVVFDFIKGSHHRRRNAPEQDFKILHVHRSGVWPSTKYHTWIISYSASKRAWNCDEVSLPGNTDVVLALGSGGRIAELHNRNWATSDAGGKSRAIFSAFCDAIFSNEDKLTGGMPQLTSLYASRPPQPLGFVNHDQLFLHGMPIEKHDALKAIQWCDRLFNRLDPITLSRPTRQRRFFRPKSRNSVP